MAGGGLGGGDVERVQQGVLVTWCKLVNQLDKRYECCTKLSQPSQKTPSLGARSAAQVLQVSRGSRHLISPDRVELALDLCSCAS